MLRRVAMSSGEDPESNSSRTLRSWGVAIVLRARKRSCISTKVSWGMSVEGNKARSALGLRLLALWRGLTATSVHGRRSSSRLRLPWGPSGVHSKRLRRASFRAACSSYDHASSAKSSEGRRKYALGARDNGCHAIHVKGGGASAALMRMPSGKSQSCSTPVGDS